MILQKLFFKIKSYERVIFLLRRHRVIFLAIIIFYLFLAAIPLGFYLFFQLFYPVLLVELLSGQISLPLIIIGTTIYYLSVWLFFFTSFVNYYLDTWTITNDRIINVEQGGPFARTVSELDLYKIQDVTSEVKGFFPTIFNYGNVYIQTAGEKEYFVFEEIPHPEQITRRIIELAEEDRKYHQAQTMAAAPA